MKKLKKIEVYCLIKNPHEKVSLPQMKNPHEKFTKIGVNNEKECGYVSNAKRKKISYSRNGKQIPESKQETKGG